MSQGGRPCRPPADLDHYNVRILVLSPRQCNPPTSGAKLREYHFLRALGEAGDVFLAGFEDPGPEPARPADLPFVSEFRYLPKPPSYRPAQLVQGVVGKWPLSVLNYTSPEMLHAVEDLARGRSFDLIHVESIHMIRYVEFLRAVGLNAPAVYNWHNIESELMLRYAATVRSVSRRMYAAITARKLQALEAEILRAAFGHLVCSERERQQLKQLAPAARIAVVENGVDCDAFSPGAERDLSALAPRNLVFVGSMDYFPNVEAVEWFARELWPQVRERLKGSEFVIVGARPTPQVLALREIPGVVVTGTVPDVKPYYQKALAAVVPLKTGGGTRLKILEAMAAGTPVVSTALGAEGLDLEPGRDYLPGGIDGPETWVRHLEELASNAKLRRDLTASGLRMARERYDWRSLGARLVETYQGWLQNA